MSRIHDQFLVDKHRLSCNDPSIVQVLVSSPVVIYCVVSWDPRAHLDPHPTTTTRTMSCSSACCSCCFCSTQSIVKGETTADSCCILIIGCIDIDETLVEAGGGGQRR